MSNSSNKGTVTQGLNERSKFDPDSVKPAETKTQRPKKAPIPTGGKQGF